MIRLTQDTLVVVSLLFLTLQQVIAKDEIIPIELGIADFPNDMARIFESGATYPDNFCEGIRARRNVDSRSGHCPTAIRQNQSEKDWSCSAYTMEPTDGSCFKPKFGTDIFSFPRVYAKCPEFYKFKNPSRTVYEQHALPFKTDDSAGPNFNHDRSFEGAYCMRCLSPFTWDQESEACVTDCPKDQEFDIALGKCINQTDKTELEHCEESAGNPVYAKTGEKRQVEPADYLGGGPFPIRFYRSYKSYRAPTAPKVNSMAMGAQSHNRYIQHPYYQEMRKNVGSSFPAQELASTSGYQQWSHNYSSRLYALDNNENQLMLKRGDGAERHFYLHWGLYKAKTDGKDKLLKNPEPTDENYWHYYSPEGTKEIYAKNGQLRQILDKHGNKLVLGYLESNLAWIQDGRGRTLTLRYDDFSRLTSLVLPDQQSIHYLYDALGNLTKVTFPSADSDTSNNPSVSYLYEDANFPLALTGKLDSQGNKLVSWQYDPQGRVIKSEHIDGNDVTHINYNENAVSITKDNGYSRKLNYQNGRLLLVEGDSCASDGSKGTKLFTYNTDGTLRSQTDNNGSATETWVGDRGLPRTIYLGFQTHWNYKRKTTYLWHENYSLPVSIDIEGVRKYEFSYDESGRLVSQAVIADKVRREHLYSYNAAGLLSSVDGPGDGDTSFLSYYDNGDLHKVTNALGQVSEFMSYDLNGRVIKVKDANDQITEYAYDSRGRLNRIQTSDSSINYSYDNNGKLVTSDFGTHQLNYLYDDDLRLTAIVDGAGNQLKFSLDAYNNVTKTQIVGEQRQILYQLTQSFDAFDRVTSQVTGSQASTQFEYDVSGDLIKTTDPLQQHNSQQLDDLRRVSKIIDELQGEIRLTYDALDNVTSVQDQNGNLTHYSYNGFGEITAISSPDTGITSFSYDKAGNMLSKQDARGIATHYAYDPLGRVSQISYPNTQQNVNYSYDDASAGRNSIGRVSSVTKAGLNYLYSYDSFGWVSEVALLAQVNDKQLNLKTSYLYKQNQLQQITYPSGIRVKYEYAQGKVTKVSLERRSGIGFILTQTLAENVKYLPFGAMTSLTYGNGKQLTYSYDLDYRLTTNKVAGVTDKNYSYDLLANISQISDSQNGVLQQELSYDALSRLVSAKGNYGQMLYSYDATGNRLTKTRDQQQDSYLYTDNKLTSVNSQLFAYDPAGNLIKRGTDSFYYSDANRLVQATVASGNYHYAYDHKGQRVIKSHEQHSNLYLYAENGLLLTETNDMGVAQVEYIYLNGKRLAMLVAGQIYYLHTNHLDAPIAITDQSANLTWQASYKPFGQIDISLDALTTGVRARFPGQYADSETGFYYNYFRDYDPEIGRYIQSDPIGLAGGINTYGYANQNSIMNTDPTGLCPWCVVGAVIGGGLNAYSQYQANGGFKNFDLGAFIASTATGALGGGLGTITKGLSGAANVAANAVGSGAIGAGITATKNKLTGSCDDVWRSAKRSAALGGLGAGFGNSLAGAGKAIPRLQAKRWWNNASVDQRLKASSNAFHRSNTPNSLTTIFVTTGNIGSNFIANTP